MKYLRYTLAALAAGLLLSAPAMARQDELLERPREEVTMVDGSKPTATIVRNAILRGASQRSWTVKAQKDGVITLEILVRGKHQVVVDVLYDAHSFQIKYVSSNNLNYEEEDGKRMIHPNYNNWVNNLAQSIKAALIQ